MNELVYAVPGSLTDVAEDSGLYALAQVGVSESTGLVNQVYDRAVKYATERAAEMVGKKWVDGELIDNPNAEWRIDEATRDEIQRIIADGLENNIGRDAIADAIEEATAFSPERAELIANTEIGSANSEGALEGYKAARDIGIKLQKVWIPDAEACEICQGNADDGPIDLDDTFSSGDDAPLAHPNCFIGSTSVSAFGASRAYRRWFEGEIITVNIGEKSFGATPNHPILTNRGFVFTKDLKVGDSLAQFCNWTDTSMVYPNNNYIETRIEQIFDSLIVANGGATATVPAATEHFHGDGIIDGEVDIVNTTSFLGNDIAEVLNDIENDNFGFSKFCLSGLQSKSALEQFVLRNFATPSSAIGSFNSCLPSDRTGSSGLSKLSFALGSDVQPKSLELAAQNGTMIAADSINDAHTAFASQISFVQVTDLIVSEFRGHVYNLETIDGWYIAESIIVSNCECVLSVTVDEDESEENLKEE